MKSAISCCAACAVAAGLMLSTVAAAAPAAGDEAQIRALEQQFSAAFNAKDVDAIMKVYVTDNSLFVFDVGTPRQHVGAADYRKDWQGFLAGFKGPLKFTLSDLAITTDGTLGFGHCVQHVTGTDPKGKPVEFVVRVSDAYKKVSGHWLIVEEHVSVPIDMATMKPDLMSKP